MRNSTGIAQLVLRFALGVGFLLPVLDRFGILGLPGSPGVAWGDWAHFVTYTHTLIPFSSRQIGGFAAGIASLMEFVFGICLILGFKLKWISLGAALLTLTFACCMAVFVGLRAPFNYPVLVFTGAALVLSGLGKYRWSMDERSAGRR